MQRAYPYIKQIISPNRKLGLLYVDVDSENPENILLEVKPIIAWGLVEEVFEDKLESAVLPMVVGDFNELEIADEDNIARTIEIEHGIPNYDELRNWYWNDISEVIDELKSKEDLITISIDE